MSPLASDLTPTDVKLFVCLYGDPGSGKSHFATHWPGRKYLFDYDVGTPTYAGVPDLWFDHYLNVERNGVLAKSAWDATEAKLQEFIKISKAAPEDLPEVLIFDSATEMESRRMDAILRDEGLSGKQKAGVASEAQWGLLLLWWAHFVAQIRYFSTWCHIFVICHEEIIQEPLTGQVKHRPLVAGRKYPGKFPNAFDEVWRIKMTTGPDGRPAPVLRIRGSDRVVAKSRLLGRTASETLPATYEAVMAALEEAKR